MVQLAPVYKNNMVDVGYYQQQLISSGRRYPLLLLIPLRFIVGYSLLSPIPSTFYSNGHHKIAAPS